VHLVELDPRQLHDYDDPPRVVGVVRVDGRPEAAPCRGKPRRAPEVGEELLDLALEAVDVASAGHVGSGRRYTPLVARLKRLARLAAAAFGALVYVWVAAVRLAPRAKRRRAIKAARRKA
jgi:hypothetical protein